MGRPKRIRTPLSQHWHRFRIGVLPVICFVACVVGTLWLWQRQAFRGNMVGEVLAVTNDVLTLNSGILESPDGLQTADATYWKVFDRVEAGQVLARLDDAEALANLATLQAEQEQLREQLDAAQAEFLQQQLRITQSHDQEYIRLVWKVEQQRLEYWQIRAQMVEDDAEIQRLTTVYERFVKELIKRGAAPIRDEVDIQANLNVIRSRMAGNQRRIDELKPQFIENLKRVEELKQHVPEFPDVDAVLRPIRAGITVQKSRIEELKVQMEHLLIKAPVAGVITFVHSVPGDAVQPGQPVVTIASTDTSYVMAYVREDHRVRPVEGATVGLRLREPGSPEYQAMIETVGPQVTQVPLHHLKDRTAIEYGTPIKITLTPEIKRDVQLLPNELVEVVLRPR